MKVQVQIVDGYGNIDPIDIETIEYDNHNLLQLSFPVYGNVIIYHDNGGNLLIDFNDYDGNNQVHALGD